MVTCITFAFVLVAGLLAAARIVPPSPVRMLAAAAGPASDDDLTTGSIIFLPAIGNICRNHLIDNATWQIRDNGVVDCKSALARSASGRRVGWSAARVDVIRSGFSRR